MSDWIAPARSLCVFAVLITIALVMGRVDAATLIEGTELVAGPSAAVEISSPLDFQVATAGSYRVVLRDIATPLQFQSLQALVTRDVQEVAVVEVDYAGSTSDQPRNGSIEFPATPGVYRIHVVGLPRAQEGAGAYAVSVEPVAGGAPLGQAADVILAQEDDASGVSVLQTTFALADAGTYSLTTTDYAFPGAIADFDTLLLQQTAGGPRPVPLVAGTFTGAPGTYELLIIATADAASGAGLYSVRVEGGPAAAQIYASTQTVGRMPEPVDLTFTQAGTYDAQLTDLVFPDALSNIGAVLIQDSQLAGAVLHVGTQQVAVPAGAAKLYVYAESQSAGALALEISGGGSTQYADAHLFDGSAQPGGPTIYSFESTQPAAAGAHRLVLDDLRLPAAFASVQALLLQRDVEVARLDHATAQDVTLQAGSVRVLVAAHAAPGAGTAPGNGLFGITLLPSGSTMPVLQQTQGDGGAFRSIPVQVSAAGPYDITLADLRFPNALATSWLAVTQGTTLEAQILGSGTLRREQLAVGTYVLNFLGVPASTEDLGVFGLKVADSPALPTITFSATPVSITSGQQTSLQWTTTNATTCTASNGWTGAKAVTGTQQSGVLTANTTFDLSCTGDGGTLNASVTVTVNPPSASGGGGGGGSMGLGLLTALLMLAGARRCLRTSSVINL